MAEPEPALPTNTLMVKGASIFQKFKDFVMENKMTIGIVVAVVGLIVVVVMFFRNYVNRMFQQNTGETRKPKKAEKTCEVIFFYTTWCPYCKKALPIWQEFSKQWNGKVKNGYMMQMSEVDCDADEATANRFEVNGYPTIKCLMNGKSTDFDAKPSLSTLNQFLDSCFSP